MIHRAKFQNFKALKDVEVTFDSRLTVLVGPNGSGKTSVLRGIHWLCEMMTDPVRFDRTLIEVRNRVAETLSVGDKEQRLEVVESLPQGDDGFRISLLRDSTWYGGRLIKSAVEDVAFDLQPRPSFVPAEFVRLQAPDLAQPSLTVSAPPTMSPQGAGLASVMAFYRYEDEDRFHGMITLFRRVIPCVQGIRITRVSTGTSGALAEGLLFDLPGRKGVPASAMSDGTLYALGLIVKILDPQRPKTLLIDDIDHGFHPKAQLTLVELLHKLLDEIPDLQVIATSHSPYILDRLNWNEVRVSSLREDGSAVIARLEDHPDFDRWKDAMSPGEFWSTFYEEWATKTKPALQPVL